MTKKKDTAWLWIFLKWMLLSVLFPLSKFLVMKVLIPLIKWLFKQTLAFCKGFKEGFIKSYYKKEEPKPKKTIQETTFQEDLIKNYAKISN